MKKLFFTFAIFTILADISSAQEWVQTNGPGDGRAEAMIALWNESVIALADSSLWQYNSQWSSWDVVANSVYASSHAKFVLDSGANDYRDSEKNVLLLGEKDVYRSIDSGKSWKNLYAEGPLINAPLSAAVVRPDGTIQAAAYGIFQLLPVGVFWGNVFWDGYLEKGAVTSLGVSRNGILYAGVGNNIYRSLGDGSNGQYFEVDSKDTVTITNIITDLYGTVYAYGKNQSHSFPTSFHALYRSTDKGITWKEFDTGLNCTNMNSMIEAPDATMIAATDNGIFYLPLGGCQWVPYTKGLTSLNIGSIACTPKGMLFAANGSSVFKSIKLFNDTLKLTGILEPGSIDYKTVLIGSSTCMDVLLKNRGIKPLTIDSFTIVDPIPFSISQLSRQLPFTLNPNDSIVVTICFHPFQVAIYSSSIIWNTNIDPSLCGISRETRLNGIAAPKNYISSSSSLPINFSVHPNPASGNSIILSLPEAQSQAIPISIYDVLGREVYQNKIPAGLKEFEIPIQNFPEGIYYARMVSGGVTVTEKFVKKK